LLLDVVTATHLDLANVMLGLATLSATGLLLLLDLLVDLFLAASELFLDFSL